MQGGEIDEEIQSLQFRRNSDEHVVERERSINRCTAFGENHRSRLNTNYIDKLLGQLVKKGMVKADGIQQDRFYRSQQFVPCLAKDEFLANILEEQGVNNALFARIAVALFKKDGKQRTPEQDEKLIAELEKMVDEYESQIEEKSKEK